MARLLAGTLFLLTVGWVGMEVRQWLFRVRAEALLADIKSLELNRSSWSDAQRLMFRWGKWGGWYGNCNADNCTYSIEIYHLRFVYPPFVYDRVPQVGARVLELVGLRSAAVTARFHVVHGIVTDKGFGVNVALPASQWNAQTYWPSLNVAFLEGAKAQSTPDQFAEHPNRGFIQRRIRLEASFTPDESPEEKAALTDFHFDCITRWKACTRRGELLPRAEKEFEAEGRKQRSPDE